MSLFLKNMDIENQNLNSFEESKESCKTENLSNEEKTKIRKEALMSVGIQSSLCLLFLEDCMTISQKRFESFNQELNNIFPLIIFNDEDGHEFPFQSWIEPIKTPVFNNDIPNDPDEDVKSERAYVMWCTRKSEKWNLRERKTLREFFTYFNEILKPCQGNPLFSIEELFKWIDQKKGQQYFLFFNSRLSGTYNATIIMLYVGKKNIVSFHLPVYDGKGEKLMSYFVSPTQPIYIKSVEEFDSWELPDDYLALSKEEAERREKEDYVPDSYYPPDEGNSCEMCSS